MVMALINPGTCHDLIRNRDFDWQENALDRNDEAFILSRI